MFVEFFAPWCGHCKSLAPEYEIAAAAFKPFASSAIIASVDADAHKALGTRFGVKGFPTVSSHTRSLRHAEDWKNHRSRQSFCSRSAVVCCALSFGLVGLIFFCLWLSDFLFSVLQLKWFPAGSLEPETYSGGRTAADIVAFVNGKAGTNARVVGPKQWSVDLDESNFDRIVLDSTKDVLVEFYAPWCGHCKKLAPDYEKAAESLAGEDSVVVAKVDADKFRSLGERFGVTGFPTLKFFPKVSALVVCLFCFPSVLSLPFNTSTLLSLPA